MADKISPQGYVIGLMPTNNNPFWGDDVPAGQGIPAGGNTGDVLTKKSDADYDAEWAPGGGGGVPGPAGPAGPAGAAGKNAVVHRFSTDTNYTISPDAGGYNVTLTVGDIFDGYTVDPQHLIDVSVYFSLHVRTADNEGRHIEFNKIKLSYDYNLQSPASQFVPAITKNFDKLYFIKYSFGALPTTDDPHVSLTFTIYDVTNGLNAKSVTTNGLPKLIGLDVVITEEA